MQLTTVKCCIAILITLNYVFSLAGDSLTSENDQEIKSNNVKYELDTAGGVQVSPVVERTPAEEAMKTIDHIVNNLPEIDAMSSVHEPESSANVDHQLQSLESGTLGDGEILDGLLNQLDVADKEILALTDEREALLVTIDEMKKTEYSFANEIAALRRELTSYNETVTDLRSQITTLQGSHQVSTESKQEERQVFETEKQELLDKIVLAERNSSGLAIKAKLERNERTIAQLSYQNCLLELEGVRSGQLDDMSELRTELAALKRKREVKCKPCSSTQVSQLCYLCSNLKCILL